MFIQHHETILISLYQTALPCRNHFFLWKACSIFCLAFSGWCLQWIETFQLKQVLHICFLKHTALLKDFFYSTCFQGVQFWHSYISKMKWMCFGKRKGAMCAYIYIFIHIWHIIEETHHWLCPNQRWLERCPKARLPVSLEYQTCCCFGDFRKILAMSEEVPDRFTGEAIFVVLLRNRSFRCGINIPWRIHVCNIW